MAEFSKLVITKKGQALIAKMISGSESVEFTKVSASSHTYDVGGLEELETLTDVKQTSTISKITRTNGVAVKVEAAFTNTDLREGYYMRTLGLYAKDPQDGEILYAVTVETSGNCHMPPNNGVSVSAAYVQIITTVGNAESVSLNVDPGAVATIGDIQELQEQISDLQAMIGYTDTDIYGVEVDLVNKRFTRLAGAVNKTAGKGFDDVHCFGGRRRCNVTDKGEVVAYQGDAAFTTVGKLAQEVTIPEGQRFAGTYPIGTEVQVMVEQPEFWYKVVPMLTEVITEGENYGRHIRKARYYVTTQPKPGFKVHPGFMADGKENELIYLAAFEGSIQDAEKGYILDDAEVADVAADKLASIAGAKPASGLNSVLTRENVRKLAEKRGKGWEQSYAGPVGITQILMLIEYASFDMQKHIGVGNASKTDDSKTSMTENTGGSVSLGNESGMKLNENSVQVVSYRGEEYFWSNIWTWIDGINVHNPDAVDASKHGRVYVADHGFTDNTDAAPYEDTGLCPVCTYGYISAFGYNEKFDWLFIPTEVSGNNALPVGDHFWNQNTGWRVAGLGGLWTYGAGCGGFCLSFNSASSYRARTVGGRLVYVPSQNTGAAA